MLTNICRLINSLDNTFTPVILSLEKHNPATSLITNKQAKFICININASLSFKYIFEILKIIRDYQINLISSHGHKADFYSVFVKLISGIPAITTIHGWVSSGFKMHLYHLLDKALLVFFTKLVLLSPVQLIRHPFLKLYTFKASIIPGGIAIESEFKARELPPDCKTIRLLVCSRLEREKDVATALKALALLDSRFYLTIAGNGSEELRLKELAKELEINDRVIFTGYCSAVHELMTSHDLLITCSLIEGLPNVVFEAGSYSLPVIASNIPEHVYLFGINAINLFNTSDSQSLSDVVMKICSTSELLKEVARNLHAEIRKQFSIEQRKTKMQAIYTEFKC